MDILITHFAVYATDLEKTKNFYMKYFEGTCNKKYENSEGFSSYFISFNSGARLEIMAHELLECRELKDKVNGWSHIAFSVGNKKSVIELTDKIVSDGYKLLSPPSETGDGYFESCVSDPDGNRVEITE